MKIYWYLFLCLMLIIPSVSATIVTEFETFNEYFPNAAGNTIAAPCFNQSSHNDPPSPPHDATFCTGKNGVIYINHNAPGHILTYLSGHDSGVHDAGNSCCSPETTNEGNVGGTLQSLKNQGNAIGDYSSFEFRNYNDPLLSGTEKISFCRSRDFFLQFTNINDATNLNILSFTGWNSIIAGTTGYNTYNILVSKVGTQVNVNLQAQVFDGVSTQTFTSSSIVLDTVLDTSHFYIFNLGCPLDATSDDIAFLCAGFDENTENCTPDLTVQANTATVLQNNINTVKLPQIGTDSGTNAHSVYLDDLQFSNEFTLTSSSSTSGQNYGCNANGNAENDFIFINKTFIANSLCTSVSSLNWLIGIWLVCMVVLVATSIAIGSPTIVTIAALIGIGLGVVFGVIPIWFLLVAVFILIILGFYFGSSSGEY